jgi:uncharacterized protein YbaR (Trm112 family)
MHILLTDILSCPRCGPDAGLILLADRIAERRVVEGTLGCARCRGRYPIHEGIADLRVAEAPTEAPADDESRGETASSSEPQDAAFRLAALMGVAEGPGIVVIAGPAAALAGGVADLIEQIEVVAARDSTASVAARPGVSVIAVTDRLPFYSGRIRAVALTGDAANRLLEEGARAIVPGGRLVLDPAPTDATERVTRAGLRILAQQDHTLVAARVQPIARHAARDL